MEKNEQEVVDSPINETEKTANQEVEVEVVEEKNEDVPEDDEETLKLKLKQAQSEKEKARKEALQKDLETTKRQTEHWKKKAEKSPELSSMDTIAIVNAGVHEDDIEKVIKYARFNETSIKDSLKDSTLRTILMGEHEKRMSAQVSNVGNSRRGQAKISDDALLQRASAGDLPEDSESISRLMKAKYKRR